MVNLKKARFCPWLDRSSFFKTCSKSQSLDSKLKLSTFSAKMLVFSVSSTGLAETVVALATYSLTSVRYPTFVALYLKRAPTCIP
ncbi:hypothetical protein TOTSKI_17780 [Facklamia hominis]